jgi:hypothetical protein
LFLHSLQ